MSQLSMAIAIAGEDASIVEVARALYELKHMEHRVWYGPGEPFPSFDEWLEKIVIEATEVGPE